MDGNTLAQLTSVKAGIGICWLGNLSWLIAADGQLVATDLDPEGRIRPSPVPTEAIAPVLDLHLITHEHGDHFSAPTCRILVERSACTFVVPASCVDKARDVGIPAARLRIARPGVPLDIAGLHVEPLHVLHGHLYGSVYRGANMEDCGYLLPIGGKKILQPGDTVQAEPPDHWLTFVGNNRGCMALGGGCLRDESVA